MLAYGYSDNGLITFSETEKANRLNVYCKEEGLDYQHFLAEAHGRRLLFLMKKQSRKNADAEVIKQ